MRHSLRAGLVAALLLASPFGAVAEIRKPFSAPPVTLPPGTDASALSVTAQGGTTARTNAARAGDVVSVKDFGAKCDGTANDGPAFNAALASNRIVQVPGGGTCLIGTTVGGTGLSDLTVQLLPGAVIKQASTLASKLFQFNNATRVRLTSLGRRGLIDVSSAPNSQAGQANDAIYFSGTTSSFCEVDHLHFYSGADYTTGGGDSHVFGSCSDIAIHDNIFEGAPDEGVYLSGLGGGDTTLGRAQVFDNLFLNCGNAGGSKRLYQGATWRNNIVRGGLNGFFSGEADTANLPGVRNDYLFNRFEGLSGPAISSRITQYDQIIGNRGFNHKVSSFIVLEGSTKADVRNNRLLIDPAVYVSPSTQFGITIQDRTFNGVTYSSTDNVITDNLFDGVYRPWSEQNASQDRNVYENNRYFGNTAAPAVLGPKSFITDRQTRALQGVASGFAGTERRETQAALRTTNGNTLNAFTLSVGNTRAVRIEVSVAASTAAGNAYGNRIAATFRRVSGGNIVQVGSTEVGGAQSDYSVSPNVAFLADTAANSIRVQVTGVAGTNIDWVLNVTYTVVATNT